jgi:hypothetical protein
MLKRNQILDDILNYRTLPARRHHLRVETPQQVWVCWGCGGLADTSRVRDLSMGGLFVETQRSPPVGATLKLDLSVHEGSIQAEAVVRHAKLGRGIGLKFTSICSEDRPRLAELVNRLPANSSFRLTNGKS